MYIRVAVIIKIIKTKDNGYLCMYFVYMCVDVGRYMHLYRFATARLYKIFFDVQQAGE